MSIVLTTSLYDIQKVNKKLIFLAWALCGSSKVVDNVKKLII